MPRLIITTKTGCYTTDLCKSCWPDSYEEAKDHWSIWDESDYNVDHESYSRHACVCNDCDELLYDFDNEP